MKPFSPRRSQAPYAPTHARRGISLLEMTLVILVLLSLVILLFVGTRAWKRGSDRTLCIMNIQAVQKGVRGYANLNDLKPGDHVTSLRARIIGFNRFVATMPTCPRNGDYDFGDQSHEDSIPAVGELYMRCSLSGTEDHQPANHIDW